MAAIPQPLHGTAQAIYAHHAARVASEAPRSYLGWSEIGGPCDRALWYSFRWAGRAPVEGRLARLFQTGHLEEDRVLAELRAIGCEVHDRDENGQQFGVSSVGGHLRGHADAVVLGLPEASKTWHLVDVKSIKSKKLDELIKRGLREMYPKYYGQGQGYMGHLGLERAAFIFSCKDDDRIHVERFEFDRAEFDRLEARGRRIIESATPPQRLSDDPAWFECKFCDFRAICHGQDVPAVNCRTCAHSTPVMAGESGAWACEAGQPGIKTPMRECPVHLYIPGLLAKLGDPVDGDQAHVRYRTAGGQEFVNGPAPGFSSAEIRACHNKAALTDQTIQSLKELVPTARVVA